LRYWEKIYGDYIKPERDRSHGLNSPHRKYTLENIEMITTIKRLLDEDLTLRGVLKRMKDIFPQY
jgi:DNA-binding transcriptional MerR regulator